MSDAEHARVFDFDRALVREPAPSVADGLRSDLGAVPDFAGIRREHAAYISALREAGVAVDVLPPLASHPDSVFLEDPALVFSEAAILLRPGAPSRRDESAALRPDLQERFGSVFELDGNGFVDGGDILVTPGAVMIGLSARTDRQGASALAEVLHRLGRRTKLVETPANVLHFKTAVSLVDEETVLVTAAIAATGQFARFRRLIVPAGEDAAANALRINDSVFVGAGFKRTIEMLEAHGHHVVPLAVTEIGKLDAGLSCLSLRWRAKSD